MTHRKTPLQLFVFSTLLLVSLLGCSLIQASSDEQTPTEAPVSPTATEAPVSDEVMRHFEPDGGFSYIPPEGWVVDEYPGLKYMIVLAGQIGNFNPNINFLDETYSGTMEEYVSLNLDAIVQVFEEASIISQEEFSTNEGLQGFKVVIENYQEGLQLIQIFYFFEAGDTKYIATYTRSADQIEALDILVDQCMKTFRFED